MKLLTAVVGLCNRDGLVRKRAQEYFATRSIVLLTLAVEATILVRYYLFFEIDLSTDFWVNLGVIVVANWVVLLSLYKASTSDNGRLAKNHPQGNCRKCSALRQDSFVHHCRTCDSCIEQMDHHCTFVGQCVGKRNTKFFLMYCFYITLLLLYACARLFGFFYTKNREHQRGVQGLTWLYFPSPLTIPYVLWYSEEEGGFTVARTVDNMLLAICVGFALFAGNMGVSCLLNLRCYRSEVDKARSDYHKMSFTKTRSFKELIAVIYGDKVNSPLDYFLPTDPVFL